MPRQANDTKSISNDAGQDMRAMDGQMGDAPDIRVREAFPMTLLNMCSEETDVQVK